MDEKPLHTSEAPGEPWPEVKPAQPGRFDCTVTVGETTRSFSLRDDLMVFASASNDLRQDLASLQAGREFATAYRVESTRVHGEEAHGVPPEKLTRGRNVES